MANRCATLEEILLEVPELQMFGPPSRGSFDVLGVVTPGTEVTITDPYSFPPVVETYVAGVDFPIGVTREDTAANLAAAMASSAVVTAGAVDSVVYVQSKKTGPFGLLGITSSDELEIEPSGPTLTGGDVQVEMFRECACSMINLECWGDKASCAHVYLTGHFFLVAQGQETGPVTARTLDKLSESYASTANADTEFGTTKYGRLYLMLRKTLIVPPIVARARLPFGPFFTC